LVPPQTARPLRLTLVTPNSGNSRGGAANTPNSTDISNEAKVVARRQMQQFEHRRPCLRKPCQFRENCRQVHVPYGKFDKVKLNNKGSNATIYSRICPMFNEPTSHTNPDDKIPSREGGLTKEDRESYQEIESPPRPRGSPRPTRRRGSSPPSRGGSPTRTRRSDRSHTRSSSEEARTANAIVLPRLIKQQQTSKDKHKRDRK
jgi:hypothetical protein